MKEIVLEFKFHPYLKFKDIGGVINKAILEIESLLTIIVGIKS
jgi:hypothetical protein